MGTKVVPVSITTIPSASNIRLVLAIGRDWAQNSFHLLLVSLAGVPLGWLLTLVLTQAWARRVEAGRPLNRPRSRPN